ncbi:MAG: hypothetical protein IJ740_09520 [Ruminococcus sp.]|nr:hypothetical protein [Ruminococcus sp.]
MKELSKLLSEIPIDELTGESGGIEREGIIFENEGSKSNGARIRTHKAGSTLAIAAAFTLVLGGAFVAVNNSKKDDLSTGSYLSKNGVSSPIENQNRSLIEQYISHMGGNEELIRDNMVIYEDPVVKENYLQSGDITLDFQILGYAYSGDVLDLFYCYEDPDQKMNDYYLELNNEVDAMIKEYDFKIEAAQQEGDYDEAQRLNEERDQKEIEIMSSDDGYSVKIKSIEDMYGGTVDIYNTEGEQLFSGSLLLGDKIGDYCVNRIGLDMTKITDKKIKFRCMFAGTQCDDVELDLSGYKKTGGYTLKCDTLLAEQPNKKIRKCPEYIVKSINYGTGYVQFEIENTDDPEYDFDIDMYTVESVYSEKGGLFSFNGLAGVVYDNDTSPVKFKTIGSDVVSLDGGKTTVVTFDTISVPLEVERIKYFLIGNRRIYVNDNEKQNEPVSVYKYPINDNSMYFFNKDTETVKELLARIKKESKEVDVSKYDDYYSQGKMITIYKDNKTIDTVCARANGAYYKEHYDSPNVLGNTVDNQTIDNLIYIDGKHYLPSKELLEEYNDLCYEISKKTPKGEEK